MINAQHFSFLLYLVNTHDVSNLEGRWRDEVKLSFRGCPHPLAFTSTHTSGGNIQTTKPILSEDHSAHISLTVTHLLFVFYLPARWSGQHTSACLGLCDQLRTYVSTPVGSEAWSCWANSSRSAIARTECCIVSSIEHWQGSSTKHFQN